MAGASPPLVQVQVHDVYLCCHLRAAGGWIKDIHCAGNCTRATPAGTPVKITG